MAFMVVAIVLVFLPAVVCGEMRVGAMSGRCQCKCAHRFFCGRAALPQRKRVQIATETMDLYVPLAHRFGLHEVKTIVQPSNDERPVEKIGELPTPAEIKKNDTALLTYFRLDKRKLIDKGYKDTITVAESQGDRYQDAILVAFKDDMSDVLAIVLSIKLSYCLDSVCNNVFKKGK